MIPFVLLLAVLGAPPSKPEIPATFASVSNSAPYSPEVPALFYWHPFTCVTLAEAVNHYVALGEEAAMKELEFLSSDWLPECGDFSRSDRIAWVCRILFEPTGRDPLLSPAYGALMLPYRSMPLTGWPLFPVAASGASYFVLGEGYMLAGQREDPKAYLAYCRAHGKFRTEKIPVPTREQAVEDLKRLRQSRAWKAIQWSDSGEGFYYTFSEDGTCLFLRKQAERIPAWRSGICE